MRSQTTGSSSPSEGDRPPQAVDATRRTRLAAERTYLAWWRTGLTSIGLAVAAGRLVPALTKGTTWPYTVVGAGYALLGVICVGYAGYRRRQVDDALARGSFAPPEGRVIAVLTVCGMALGLVVLAVIALET